MIAVLGIAAPEAVSQSAKAFTDRALETFDGLILATVSAFVVLLLVLAIGRTGRIRLGRPDEKPEFSIPSWLAMLFAAGMGVGLLFWGVAEPMTHFASPPQGSPLTEQSARRALVLTAFHWGLHAWAVYAVAALVIAYFSYRRGHSPMPGTAIRVAFGGRAGAAVGGVADLVAVIAVAFGVAASIAMGVLQIHGGLTHTLGVPAQSTLVPVVILLVIVASYMASAATDLSKGIKWLSNINMTLAILLLGFLLLAGPTLTLLGDFIRGVSDYVMALPSIASDVMVEGGAGSWLHTWTLTYFLWWIAWAPFVGLFIARISRGRTIRQFVVGVVGVPTVFSLLWFAVFGWTGIHEQLGDGVDLAAVVSKDVTVALFTLFEQLPLSGVLSAVALALVFIFLITSADSATFVLGMLSANGSLDPPRRHKLGWGIGIGVLGGALALTNSIDVVRAVTVTAAFPFFFVMILQAIALLKVLRSDPELRAHGTNLV